MPGMLLSTPAFRYSPPQSSRSGPVQDRKKSSKNQAKIRLSFSPGFSDSAVADCTAPARAAHLGTGTEIHCRCTGHIRPHVSIFHPVIKRGGTFCLLFLSYRPADPLFHVLPDPAKNNIISSLSGFSVIQYRKSIFSE